MRIGIVGTESSHVDHYVRLLNVARRYGEARVVALCGDDPGRTADVAGAGGIERVVDSPEALAGLVDAAIVADRDGARHRAHAEPLLAAGLPVYVDKPLACDVADAEALIAAARSSGAPLTSYSALRWTPETDALLGSLGETGGPQVVMASGPADTASEHGGIFFYGVHVVELALHLAGITEAGPVHVHRFADRSVATVTGKPTLVLEFVRPSAMEGTYWRVVAAGPTSMTAAEIRLGEDYIAPGLERFLTMVETRRWPLSEEELLAPVKILSAVAPSV